MFLFIFLALLSAGIYGIHFLIFKDLHHIFIYLIGDLAFLPLEILFVSLIFHKLLDDIENKNTFRKLNMIIGVFFSQVGNQLLQLLINNDKNLIELQTKLHFNTDWGEKDFRSIIQSIEKHKFNISVTDIEELRQLLLENREFMMKTIENPSLLEHELFSELIMAIFHLEEELSSRTDINNMGEKDKAHIDLDVARVYRTLIKQWILYIQHLKKEYPYLYSFLIRTNPFDTDAKVEIS